MKIKTPTPEILRFAADWLRRYDEKKHGYRKRNDAVVVASWLDDQADKKELHDMAVKCGLSVKKIRTPINRKAQL